MLAICALGALGPLAAGTPGVALAPHHSSVDDRPNILVIVTDDQRLETFSKMSKTRRWFFKGGVRYRNAFATTPLCCPARASIMTGRYTHNHGVLYNGEWARSFDEDRAIQSYLSREGYLTGIAGKYFNGWDLSVDPQHFDRWAISGNGGHWGMDFNLQGRHHRVKTYHSRYVGKKGIEFLDSFETSDERPWFLYLAPYAAHTPFIPERRFADAPLRRWAGNPAVFEKDKSDKPSSIRRAEVSLSMVREVRARQLRMMMSVDDMLRSIVRRLSELNEGRDTLAIFISDNGILWGEHGGRGKDQPYRPAVRVPLMLRWPGHVVRGTVEDRLVANIDVAPTVLEAAGVELPEEESPDGTSLLTSPERSRLLLETFRPSGEPRWAATVTEEFHYTERYSADGEIAFREYYDLRADEWMLENLLGDDEVANDPFWEPVSVQLAADRTCAGDSCP